MTLLAPLVVALALGGAPDLRPRLAPEPPRAADAAALDRALARDAEAWRESKEARTRRGKQALLGAGVAALAGLVANVVGRTSEDPIGIGFAKVESYAAFAASAGLAAFALHLLGTDPPEATP